MEWTAFSDVAIPACKSHWPKLVSTNNIEIQSNQTARVNKSNNNIKWRNTRYNICVAWWIEGAAEKKIYKIEAKKTYIEKQESPVETFANAYKHQQQQQPA